MMSLCYAVGLYTCIQISYLDFAGLGSDPFGFIGPHVHMSGGDFCQDTDTKLTCQMTNFSKMFFSDVSEHLA